MTSRIRRLSWSLGLCALSIWIDGCGAPENTGEDPVPEPEKPDLPSGGVCGFTTPVTLGAPDADGFVDVPANHPSLFYYGRIDCSNPLAPAFAYPGVTVRARFRGDAVDMKLADFGKGGAQGTNFYDVIVDGGVPLMIEVSPRTEVYPLARGLPPGVHTIEIIKRNESGGGSGKGVFRGLRIHGDAALFQTRNRAHRIEFIGDSITCGYGDEVSTDMPDKAPYTTRGSNARLAFGSVAALALDAEYMAVAYSGRGMYRNYAGQPGLPLPGLYLRTFPDDDQAAAWLPARAIPEIVVINLGTNDFSPGGVDRTKFRAAYIEFLKQLRGSYPKALFVLTAGPMLSDFYPAGEMAWTSIRADIKTVVEDRKLLGDTNLQTLFFDPQGGPWGQDYHPTAATHQEMADKLVPFVKGVSGW